MSWAPHLHDFTTYLAAAGLTSRTIRLRRYYLERFARAHPDPWLVTTTQILRWLTASDWSAETKRSARAAIRVFYAWAVDFDLIAVSPAAKVPSVRVPTGIPKPAPEDVVSSALVTTSDRDRLMVMLAAYAGLRRAEIAALRWDCLTAIGLHVRGKGGRDRLIPVNHCLLSALRDERDRRHRGGHGTGWRYGFPLDSPYLFPGTVRPHMHPDSVGAILAGVLGQGWSGHTLRHRFATKAYQGTQDLRAVQQLMGHSSPVTTSRYVMVDEKALRAAVDAAA